MQNSNEIKFFETLIGSSGWRVKLNPEQSLGDGSISEMDTNIYVVDVRTGWIAAAAMKREGFELAMKDLERSGMSIDAMRAVTSALIRKASGSNAQGSDPDITAAMNAAVPCLACTKTYEVAMSAPDFPNHWIYLMYTTRGRGAAENVTATPDDVEPYLRPFCLSVPGSGFLKPKDLISVVRDVVEMDTQNRQSQVCQGLLRNGGAVINDMFLKKKRR